MDGSQVKVFVPVSKITVELAREGDDVLVGKITFVNGQEYPIKLTKTKLSNQSTVDTQARVQWVRAAVLIIMT